MSLPLVTVAATPALLFLICQPGGVPLSEEEQAQVRQLAERLAPQLGVQLTARYESTDRGCAEALAAGPAVVMPSLRVFLEQAPAKGWRPVVVPRLLGDAAASFHLWGPAGTGPGLGGLAKLRLTGTDLAPQFLERIIFHEKPGPLLPEALALRAIRAVKKGAADRVLLDEAQHRALLGSPLAVGLTEVWTSERLPAAPIVVVPGVGPASLESKLRAALLGLAGEKSGQQLLQAFGLLGFEEAAAGVYRPLTERLARP